METSFYPEAETESCSASKPMSPTSLLFSSSFIQGFIAGQIALIILVCSLIWMVCLKITPPKRDRYYKVQIKEDSRNSQIETVTDSNNIGQKKQKQIKNNCNVNNSLNDNALESCTWLSEGVQRLFLEFHKENKITTFILSQINDFLNDSNNELQDILGSTVINDFFIDKQTPVIKSASIQKKDGLETIILINLEYSGLVQVGVDTSLLLNWPVKELACLPISFSIKILSIIGTMCIHFPSSAQGKFKVYFSKEPVIDLQLKSDIGSEPKVQDLPKLEEILLYQLNAAIKSFLVTPAFLKCDLPVDLLDVN